MVWNNIKELFRVIVMNLFCSTFQPPPPPFFLAGKSSLTCIKGVAKSNPGINNLSFLALILEHQQSGTKQHNRQSPLFSTFRRNNAYFFKLVFGQKISFFTFLYSIYKCYSQQEMILKVTIILHPFTFYSYKFFYFLNG